MKNTIICCFLGFIAIASSLFAGNQDTHELSNKNLPIINKTSNAKAHIYIFSNYNSCNSCLGRLSDVAGYLKNNEHIDLVLFLSGTNHAKMNEIVDFNNWDFDVIADPIGVYFKEYNISKNNTLIFLDNNGSLLYSDNYENAMKSAQLKSLIDNLPNQNNESTFQQLKNVVFTKNSQPIIASRYQKLLYSKKNDKYYYSNNKNSCIDIFDSTGNFISSIFLNQLMNFQNVICNVISWKIKDKVLFLHYNGRNTSNFEFSNIFFEVDIVDESVKQLHGNYLDSIKGIAFVQSYTNGYAVFENYNKDVPNTQYANSQPIVLLDNKYNKISQVGKMTDIYKIYDLRKAFLDLSASSDKHLYYLQSYSKTMQIIDLENYEESSINLSFPSSFRQLNQGISFYPNHKEWLEIGRNMSVYRGFEVDTDNNYILTMIKNDNIPDGVEDPFSPLITSDYYLNVFDGTGDLLSDDYKLPFSFPMVSFFDSNEIAIVHCSNNTLQVQWYQFIKNP